MTPRASSATPREPTPEGAQTLFGQALLDQLSEGVYFVDPARRIQSWNRGAEALTGYAASGVVGRFCHDNLLNHVDAGGRNRAVVDPS